MDKCCNDVLQLLGGLSSLQSAWHYISFPWHWIIRLIGWSPPSPHLTIMRLNTRATTSTFKEFLLYDYQQLSAARHYFQLAKLDLAKGPAPDYFMGNAQVRFLFTIWVVSDKERVSFLIRINCVYFIGTETCSCNLVDKLHNWADQFVTSSQFKIAQQLS